jgi:hypothetical protein
MSASWGSRLGRIGAWLHPRYGDDARTEFAVEAETLGYSEWGVIMMMNHRGSSSMTFDAKGSAPGH